MKKSVASLSHSLWNGWRHRRHESRSAGQTSSQSLVRQGITLRLNRREDDLPARLTRTDWRGKRTQWLNPSLTTINYTTKKIKFKTKFHMKMDLPRKRQAIDPWDDHSRERNQIKVDASAGAAATTVATSRQTGPFAVSGANPAYGFRPIYPETPGKRRQRQRRPCKPAQDARPCVARPFAGRARSGQCPVRLHLSRPYRPAASIHAYFPHSVTLMQLRFTSFAVINLRRDLQPQESAHARHTKKSPLALGARGQN